MAWKSLTDAVVAALVASGAPFAESGTKLMRFQTQTADADNDTPDLQFSALLAFRIGSVQPSEPSIAGSRPHARGRYDCELDVHVRPPQIGDASNAALPQNEADRRRHRSQLLAAIRAVDFVDEPAFKAALPKLPAEEGEDPEDVPSLQVLDAVPLPVSIIDDVQLGIPDSEARLVYSLMTVGDPNTVEET